MLSTLLGAITQLGDQGPAQWRVWAGETGDGAGEIGDGAGGAGDGAGGQHGAQGSTKGHSAPRSGHDSVEARRFSTTPLLIGVTK